MEQKIFKYLIRSRKIFRDDKSDCVGFSYWNEFYFFQTFNNENLTFAMRSVMSYAD